MANHVLTKGCLPQIMSGAEVQSPVLQVISLKQIRGGAEQNSERYRMSLSDGAHHCPVMLATQCNDAVHDGSLQPMGIIRVEKYICNDVRGKTIVIVLGLEVLKGPTDRIGTPIDFEQSGGAPQQQQQQHVPQQQHQQQQHVPQQQPSQAGATEQHFYDGEDISQNPICPIRALTPYRQRWTIKARVTAKAPIRTWQNEKSSGCVSSVNLRDEQGGEIQATLWKEAVEKFYDLFELNRVYFISKGSIKQANRRYSSLNAEYEINLDNYSVVQPAPEDNTIAPVVYHFRTIDEIMTLPNETVVDLYGIIVMVGESQDIKTKAGKEVQRRNITLGDRSGNSIELTLWGDFAKVEYENSIASVLAVKGVRVSDFNEKSLSSTFSSDLQLNPDIPECNELKQWYNSQGGTDYQFNTVTHSRGGGAGGAGGPRSTGIHPISQMKEEAMVNPETATYFNVRGTIVLFRKDRNVSYAACPTCQKKVQNTAGYWHCEKCSESYDSPQYRYILSCNISDHTSSVWVSSFDEVGKKIMLDVSAEQLHEWKEGQIDGPYDTAFDDASFRSYKFRIRAKQDTYQGEPRMKYAVSSIFPIDFVEDTASILKEIHQYGS